MEKQDRPIPSSGIKIRYFDGDAWGQGEIRIPIDMSVTMEEIPGEAATVDDRDDL